MITRSINELQHTLVQVFSDILQQRMDGIPIVNSRLGVAATPFMQWQEFYLGVLSTPWFMNLVLVPATLDCRENLERYTVGQKLTHLFPSGLYEFTVSNEPAIGHFETCSLFSPMFDFPDQATVLTTADEVMQGLMEPGNREQEASVRQSKGTQQSSFDDPGTGEQINGENLDQLGAPMSPLASANDDSRQLNPPSTGIKKLSRRQLLTGGLHE